MSFDAALAGGPYNVTWGGSTVGLMDNSLGMEVTPFAELLANSHTYGRQPLGGIYLGNEVKVHAVLRLWNSVSKDILWPWNGTLGTPGTVGRDIYDIAKALVASAVAGTPAATAGPATITLTKCIIEPGVPIPITLNSTWRTIPVSFLVMLDSSGNHFSTT